MIDRGRLGAEYSGVRRMKNGGSASAGGWGTMAAAGPVGGSASKGTSLKDAYSQAASSMKAAGVTSVSGANTTQAAREAVSKAAAAAKAQVNDESDPISPEMRAYLSAPAGSALAEGPPPASAVRAASFTPAAPATYSSVSPVDLRYARDLAEAAAAPASNATVRAAPAAAPVSATTKGPVPIPPPRPAAQPTFFGTLKALPGAIANDVRMGYSAGFLSNREEQRKNLAEAGYSPAQIDDFFARTDATIARNEAEAAAARRDRDDSGIMSLPGAAPVAPTLTAEELARLFAEGQNITGRTQAELQPLVEQFLRGRGIMDFGTYLPKIFETLQVPSAAPVSPAPQPTFVTPTDAMASQPNFVNPFPTSPAPNIPPFVPITPVGVTGAYSPAPINRAMGGPVQKMQSGGEALSTREYAEMIGRERGVDYNQLRATARPGTPEWRTMIDIVNEANALVTPSFVAMGAPDVRDFGAIRAAEDPLAAARSAVRQVASSGIDTGVTPARDFYADLVGKTAGTGAIRTELDPTGKYIDVYDAAGNLMRRDLARSVAAPSNVDWMNQSANQRVQELLNAGASLADIQRLVPGAGTGTEFTPLAGNFLRSDAQSMIDRARAEAEQRAPLDFFTDALQEAQNIGRMIQQSNEAREGDPEYRAQLRARYQKEAADLAAKSGFVVDPNTGQLVSRPDVPLVPNVTIYPDNLKAMMSPATFAAYQQRFQQGAAQPVGPSLPGGAAGPMAGVGSTSTAQPAAYTAPAAFTPITPVGAGEAYAPPNLPAAPAFGATASGQTAYSPYGQTLPFSFPQLELPPLGASFLKYLPPLNQQSVAPLTPQSVPLV